MDDIAQRHKEPHTCTREGAWAACDYNRYINNEPISSIEIDLLAEALWFEGLIDTPTPISPQALQRAYSLLGAIKGLRKYHNRRNDKYVK